MERQCLGTVGMGNRVQRAGSWGSLLEQETIHTLTHTHTLTCTHTPLHAHTHTHTHTHPSACTHAHIPLCTHTLTLTHTHPSACTHTHTHAHTHTPARTHTHTLTHTPPRTHTPLCMHTLTHTPCFVPYRKERGSTDSENDFHLECILGLGFSPLSSSRGFLRGRVVVKYGPDTG